MKFGLCIVGCGNFAKVFAKAIQPMLDRVNVYFASRDLAKAHTYNKLFNGSGAYGSYESAARSPSIQAMYICTPHHLHLEHVAVAAKFGKHILVEKPIATTINEGELLIETTRKYNVTLMVAENYRFMPAVRFCKTLADQGNIGQIRVIQIQQESSYQPQNWRQDYQMNGGGVFIDAGIHKVHFLRYLAGEPENIYAVTTPRNVEGNSGEDGLLLLAQWDTGTIGLIHHAWNPSNQLSKHWISLSGTAGKIYFEIGQTNLHMENQMGYKCFPIDEPLDGLLPMAEEFINSANEGRTPEISGEEGLKDLTMVLKAYESVHDKKAIEYRKSGNVNRR